MFVELLRSITRRTFPRRQQTAAKRAQLRRHLSLESLEPRTLLAVAAPGAPLDSTITHAAAAPHASESPTPKLTENLARRLHHTSDDREADSSTRESTNPVSAATHDVAILALPTALIPQDEGTGGPSPPGDYNVDGIVDAADYAVWQDTIGTHVTPFTGADGDGDGRVDESDFEIWLDHFGQGQPFTPPSIISAAPTGTISVETPVTFYVRANGNPLPTYGLENAPAGMSIDSTSGVVTWAPTTDEEGTQTATVTATNSMGQATQSFSLNVIPRTPSGLTATGTSATSIALTWNASTDPNITGYNVYERTFLHNPRGSGGTYHYHLLASNLAATTFVATGLTQGSGHTYVITAVSTTNGLASGYSAAVAGQTWFPPTLRTDYLTSGGAVFSGPVNVAVDQTVQITLLGSGNPAVAYSALDAPPTLTVDPTTGVVTFTPDATEIGLLSVTFQVENAMGVMTQTFQFNVS